MEMNVINTVADPIVTYVISLTASVCNDAKLVTTSIKLNL